MGVSPMSLSDDITRVVQGSQHNDELEREQFIETTRSIIKSSIVLEVSKWDKRGHDIVGLRGKIGEQLQNSERFKGVFRDTARSHDYIWFKEQVEELVSDIAYTNLRESDTGQLISGNHNINPRDFPLEQLVDDLVTGVVRLVFIKKGRVVKDDEGNIVRDEYGNTILDGGEKRVMYGTRNASLITLYDKSLRERGTRPRIDNDDPSSVQRELESDVIRLLDLEKEEFRAFKPSTLVEYDSGNGVGSWIKFEVENDAWFNIVKEGKAVQDYYIRGNDTQEPGVRTAVANNNRTVLEEQYYREGVQSGAVKTPAVVQWERRNNDAFIAGERLYIELLTGSYLEPEVEQASNGIKDYLTQMDDVVRERKNELDLGFLQVGKRTKKRRLANTYELLVGDAVIVASPYFIVNTKTGKVYLDRYDLFRFGAQPRFDAETERIALASDAVGGSYINGMIQALGLPTLPLPKKRRRVLSTKDELRISRLNYIYNNRTQPVIKNYLKKTGITINYNDSREMYKLSILGTGVVFMVNSRTIEWADPMTKEPTRIVTTARYTSALKIFRQALAQLRSHYRTDAKVIKAIKVLEEFLVDFVFDLRVTNEKFQETMFNVGQE